MTDRGPQPDPDLRGALHDVANALTVVLGWLELAEQALPDPSSAAHALAMAREHSRHGRRIALQAMGDPRAAEDPSMSCAALVHLASSTVEPMAKTRALSVRVQMAPPLEHVLVQAPSQALQVLTNLLLNAFCFAPEHTEVLLEASEADERSVRLVVSDQGPGFAPEHRAQVFDGLRSTRKEGNGVGLRASHQVAQQQGGTLRLLESDQGASFELRWPKAPQQPEPGSQAERRPPLADKRVLVVEDDAAVVMFLETALEARGASVRAARDWDALQRALQDDRFDAALVDLSPVHQNLDKALEQILAHNPQTKLVLISGASKPPALPKLSRPLPWVRKPFEIEEVLGALVNCEPFAAPAVPPKAG